MELVSVDVAGPFPTTKKGNQYILTICDCFTKWIEEFAMKDQESTTIRPTIKYCLFPLPRPTR